MFVVGDVIVEEFGVMLDELLMGLLEIGVVFVGLVEFSFVGG